VLWGDEGLWAQQQPLKMVKLMFVLGLPTFLGSKTSLLTTFLINASVTFNVLLHFQLPPTKNFLMLLIFYILNLKLK
jgi:hypothetical protein